MKELADKIYHYAKIILWAAERFRDIVYSWPGFDNVDKPKGEGGASGGNSAAPRSAEGGPANTKE